MEDPVLKNAKVVREVFNLIKKLYPYKIKVLTSKGKNKYCKLDPKFGIVLASYFFEKLNHKADIMFNTEALKLERSGKNYIVHTTSNKFISRRCIVATGKNSIDWINFFASL